MFHLANGTTKKHRNSVTVA